MPINLSIILTAIMGIFLFGLAYSNYGIVKSDPSKRIFTYAFNIENLANILKCKKED